MIKLSPKIKVLSINILLAFIGSLTISEIYLRLLRPKMPMEVYGTSYIERLNNAKVESINTKNLTLVIGDSFAHHQIGTNGNFFDSVFNCQRRSDCSYHNLAQSGVGLPFYWNTIASVLDGRNSDINAKIIMSIYFGNDPPFLNS